MGMSVLQEWVTELPLMQQSVLLGGIRGPDGVKKYNSTKMIIRWLRRCILISSFDKCVLTTPWDPRGGSFTGPSGGSPITSISSAMEPHFSEFFAEMDGLPYHFIMHLLHCAEILGYKHPDHEIATSWLSFYHRIVKDMHLTPETREELDTRLGDSREAWETRTEQSVKY